MYPSSSINNIDYPFFSPIVATITILGLIILFILVFIRRRRNNELDYYKYLIPAFTFKIIFVFANAIYYAIVLGGGDSFSYWEGGLTLNKLFWKDPLAYFEEIFQSYEFGNLYKNFDINTGYPPGWIYKEEGFFISKIVSIVSFFTFKGYLLMSFIFAYFTTMASWRLFEVVRSYKLHSDWHIALALFFIPSLSFWCGGISKDSVIFVSVCYLLYNLYQILDITKASSFRHWIGIFICLYVLMQVRSFMIITVLIPFAFAYSARITKKMKDKPFQRNFIKFLFVSASIAVVFLFFQSQQAEEFATEAAVISQDMANNQTYGTKRYDLGVTDYSFAGMVTAIPASIIAGIYRPFIWESLSFSLILNGLESIVLIYFSLRFFMSSKVLSRMERISSNEFLVFAFFFALILAYFAGFTSILFGVLVRFKAPVLPFLVLVLTAHYLVEKNNSSKL
jgi:hypothetical protein